ncbi:MAG: pilus assembly protein PilM [Lachnospiraceae bacterium]|nr:pilus assembly protein PilM [Lachnospiraceae bacterium]
MDQRLLSIYIGAEVIRIVDATRKSATSITVNSVDEVSTPAGSFDDGYITDVLEIASAIRSKIIGKSNKAKAIFTISSKKIASKEVVIPFVNGKKKIDSVLNANSSEYFPMSTTGEFIFAYNVMESFQDDDGKKLRINAVAAPKDLVEGYYEIADELKLIVYDIDYVGNSVQQLLKLQMSDNENDTNLVLQIEKDATFVNIMAGKDIILQRSVPYGKNAVINSIMEIKKLTEKEAIELLRDKTRMDRSVSDEEYSEAVRYLISSIGRIVEYHRSRNPERIIDGINVFGEGASIAGIDEVLRQELGAEVTRFNTLNGIKVSQKSYLSADQALRFLACFGAVLNPIGLKIENNKKGEASSADISKILIVVDILVALVMIGICAYFQVKYVLKKADVDFKKSQIDQMEIAEQVADEYEKTVQSYNTVKVFADTTHSDNIKLFTLLEDMEDLLPTGTEVSSLECAEGGVTMVIHARSKEQIADAIVQFKSLPYVSDVMVASLEEHLDDMIIADNPEDIYTTDYTTVENTDLAKLLMEKQLIRSLFGDDPQIDTGKDVVYQITLQLHDLDFVAGEIQLTDTNAAPAENTENVEGGAE